MNANWCHVWVSLIEHSNPPQTKHIYIQVHQEYMFQFRVNKTDNNAFTCPVPACGRKYSRMSDLKSHFSLKHYEKFPEYPNMRTVGRYSCVGCCHTFTRKKTSSLTVEFACTCSFKVTKLTQFNIQLNPKVAAVQQEMTVSLNWSFRSILFCVTDEISTRLTRLYQYYCK